MLRDLINEANGATAAPPSRASLTVLDREDMSIQLPDASIGVLTVAEQRQAMVFFDFCVGDTTRDHVAENVSVGYSGMQLHVRSRCISPEKWQ